MHSKDNQQPGEGKKEVRRCLTAPCPWWPCPCRPISPCAEYRFDSAFCLGRARAVMVVASVLATVVCVVVLVVLLVAVAAVLRRLLGNTLFINREKNDGETHKDKRARSARKGEGND